MKTKNLVVVLVLSSLVLVVGCVGTPSALKGPKGSLRAPAGLRYEPNNDLLHVYSKALFPPEVGSWRMFAAEKYDNDGHDVSVGYATAWGDFVARADIYVYPTYAGAVTQDLLRAHYQQVKNDVFKYKKNVTLLAEQEGTWSLPSGDRYCLSAVFNLEMSGRKMTSYLFLFGQHEWYILWRISHPAEANVTGVPPKVSSLVESIDYSVIE
jgi:hypothetical protein